MKNLILTFGSLLLTLPAYAEVWNLQSPKIAFDYSSGYQHVAYEPLERAKQNWSICVAFPHLKDAYWLSVNYGMVQEARRLGVSFQLVEAGGYPNIERQIDQITSCVNDDTDALVLGAVSFDGLTETMTTLSSRLPIIAAVNDIADEGITAKVGVSWREMGLLTGQTLAKRHPLGSAPVQVAWFPGPEAAGWVKFVEQGFLEGIQQSAVSVVATRYGDTGREIQVRLVEEVLDQDLDIDYIVGSAPTAEAAVSVLRARGLQDDIQILSDYVTHAVFRGLHRGRIVAAPTDFPVLQGKLAIETAVRAIEGSVLYKHIGPITVMLNASEDFSQHVSQTLAPANFVPVFSFKGSSLE